MFIDTNVFVHARMGDGVVQGTARQRLRNAMESERVFISRQVLREYFAVVTRPDIWPAALPPGDAIDDIRRLIERFEILTGGPSVTSTLLALCREVPVLGTQIHDANIVATMLARGERQLLTFNGPDFRRYGDRIELLAP